MSDIVIEGNGTFPMDVRIPIVGAQLAANGAAAITARGEHRGGSVGVEIIVRGQMKPGIVGAEIDTTAFYGGGAIIRSRGNSSIDLADVFSEAYILPLSTAKPIPQLDLTTIALRGNPALIETEHLNFKVFHDDENKMGLYFEMFLHIDIPGGYVRFDEKDEEYRPNVVKSFASLRFSPA